MDYMVCYAKSNDQLKLEVSDMWCTFFMNAR